MSKIEVNKIGPQCGTTLTVGCGAGQTVTVDANTVTIGRCGGTVALASGASQTGFGRTGTVDWQTGDIKTSTFTAVNGQGFFVDTNGGAVTANLPAGSAGAIVAFQDYRNTFDTASLVIDPNGSEKINGGDAGGFIQLNSEGEGATLVYIDSTIGWRSIHQSVFSDVGDNSLYVTASGGTESTCGDFKIHKFTGPGTFAVTCAGNACGSNTVDYMVVAGGGGGAGGGNYGFPRGSGAGGGGGVRLSATTYTNSGPSAPRSSGVPGLSVPVASYPITVGGAGAGGVGGPGAGDGGTGSNSVFSTITSAGGAKGAGHCHSYQGQDGGSGGSGANASTAGDGNVPPVSPPQGMPGGNGGASSGNFAGGGGGGFMTAGSVGNPGGQAGPGGAGGGYPSAMGTDGQPSGGQYYVSGGGGGGNGYGGPGGSGGLGGGGSGSSGSTAGSASHYGGGGGGAGSGPGGATTTGGAGSGGLVIIRYKFQN